MVSLRPHLGGGGEMMQERVSEKGYSPFPFIWGEGGGQLALGGERGAGALYLNPFWGI